MSRSTASRISTATTALVPLPSQLPATRGSLPIPLTRLVGRTHELARLAVLMDGESGRLVTLTGPGGVGKTRLAVAIAEQLAPSLANGAAFVPLATIRDPDLVMPSIAQHLGIRLDGDAPVNEQLWALLAPRQMLLVLDNFEQVLAAAAEVGELLSRCPRLRVLVTSRSRLHVYGERMFSVPPLALPDPHKPAAGKDLADAEAVRLFVERARSAHPHFELTDEAAVTIAAICRRLDGLPLAIELAAARVAVLSPPALLARLEPRLSLLTGGTRDQPVRHRTLRNAIGWTYDLLSPQERVLFRRLSVFSGGFTLNAAEAVGRGQESGGGVRGNGDPALPDPQLLTPDPSVLDGIAALVDQSLVQRVEREGGEPGFAMLETIGEFAGEQLEASGEADAVRNAHADYFLALAERIEPAMVVQRPAVMLAQLNADRSNLRAALAWLERTGQAERFLRLAGALGAFWDVHGPVGEGRDWIARALDRADPAPSLIRAKALEWAGLLARAQGDSAQAVALEEAGLAIARQIGDPRSIADALHSLGQAAVSQGDFQRAAAAYAEALDCYRELDSDRAAFALVNLGIVTAQQGDATRATAILTEGLAAHRAAGNTWGAGFALRALGDLTRVQGDTRQATDSFRECAELWLGHGYHRGVGHVLVGLAAVARATGQAALAARLLGAAESIRVEAGLALWATEQAAWEQTVEEARAALGEPAFAAAWKSGQELPLADAVAEALTIEAEVGRRKAETIGAPSAISLPPPTSYGLTRREIEVLRLLAEGLADRQIAETLFISRNTVHRHLAGLYDKLGVHNRTGAIALARASGLIDLDPPA